MSSSAEISSVFGDPVAALQYRDIGGQNSRLEVFGSQPGGDRGMRGREDGASDAELAAKIRQERADAALQAEQKLRHELDQKLEACRSAIAAAVGEFAVQRDDYFARVEAEVVRLALSIAAKILHREAQVDPMLVATLVRIAVEKMREGSTVTVRVGPGRAESWRACFAAQQSTAHVAVVEDSELNGRECVLETELGSADFSLESQLKEVEKGFFDLLALRPSAR